MHFTVESVRKLVVKCMESAMTLAVPLVVGSASGSCWIDVK